MLIGFGSIYKLRSQQSSVPIGLHDGQSGWLSHCAHSDLKLDLALNLSETNRNIDNSLEGMSERFLSVSIREQNVELDLPGLEGLGLRLQSFRGKSLTCTLCTGSSIKHLHCFISTARQVAASLPTLERSTPPFHCCSLCAHVAPKKMLKVSSIHSIIHSFIQSFPHISKHIQIRNLKSLIELISWRVILY